MLIRCTNCQTPLDIGPDETAYTKCPSCETNLAPTSPDTNGQQPGQFIAHFQLREQVGKGTYGAVWKAWDTNLERPVALKLPRAESVDLEKLLKEARAAAQIRHPSVVEVFEVGVSPNQPYIATRFVEGKTLEEWLANRELDEGQVTSLISQLADGIHSAHELGVIHRDLKPANILVDDEGQPHITDFGVAKREDSDSTLHADGEIIGTPSYMSPEQARGDGSKADRRSDVYSLGAILYRILSGRAPFTGSPRVVIPLVLSQLPDALDRSISEPLRAICDKAMSKAPDDRYETAASMAEDLRKFEGGEAITAVVQPQKVVKRKRGWLKAIALMLLASVVSLGCLFYEDVADYALGPFPVPDELAQDVLFQTNLPMKRLLCYPVRGDTCMRDKTRSVFEQNEINSDTLEAKLKPGRYLVVAEATTGEFHEVFRTVPGANTERGRFKHNSWKVRLGGQIRLPQIRLFSNDEVFHDLLPVDVPDGYVNIGTCKWQRGSGAYQMRLPSYFLSRLEISAEEFGSWLRENGCSETATEKDASDLGFCAVNLRNDEVDAFLEAHGCRLPDEHEFEYALTAGNPDEYDSGRISPERFSLTILSYENDEGPFGHKHLFGRAAEMTLSPEFGAILLVLEESFLDQATCKRSLRGGHTRYQSVNPNGAQTSPLERVAGSFAPEFVGFRAARSRKPRWNWRWQTTASVRKEWEHYDEKLYGKEAAPDSNAERPLSR